VFIKNDLLEMRAAMQKTIAVISENQEALVREVIAG
jgi:hypothetical protein